MPPVSGPGEFSIVNAVSWRVDAGWNPFQAVVDAMFQYATVWQDAYGYVVIT
jgi:hypothetical protein